MRNVFLASLSLAIATPAAAADGQVQGPIATAAAPTSELGQVDPAVAERLRLTRSANRWEAAYLTLSAIDAAQTCDALSRGVGSEGNPLLGKNPSCGKVVAFKAIMGGLHYLLFDHIRDRDPKGARLGAQISVVAQGAMVGLNLRYTFMGR